MSNNNSLCSIKTDSVEAFINGLAAMEAAQRPNIPGPALVSLDGNEGTFSIMRWNNEKKENEFHPFGQDGSRVWKGSILFMRYFAKWKFKENATLKIITREFASFNEPVTLLVIDKEHRETPVKETTFENYAAFKKKYSSTDEITGDVKTLFDFWVSLYVFVPGLGEDGHGQVINYRFKGDTRSNYFDFMNRYKKDVANIRHMVEARVVFSQEEKEMPAREGKPSKKYYAGTFRVEGKNSIVEMEPIMAAFQGVQAWMAQFNGTNTQPTEESVPTGFIEGEAVQVERMNDLASHAEVDAIMDTMRTEGRDTIKEQVEENLSHIPF